MSNSQQRIRNAIIKRLRYLETFFRQRRLISSYVHDVDLLPTLVAFLKERNDSRYEWLFLACVYGAFPTTAEFARFHRHLQLNRPDTIAVDLLHWLIPWVRKNLLDELPEVFEDTVVVGGTKRIQPAVSAWANHEHLVTTKWNRNRTQFIVANHDDTAAPTSIRSGKSIIPFEATVIFTKPLFDNFEEADRIACLARYSGSTVNFVGFGLPALSDRGDFVPSKVLADKVKATSAFISALKYSDRVACVDEQAYRAFTGLNRALGTQGLSGPELKVIPLPTLDVGAQVTGHLTDHPEIPEEWNSYAEDSWRFFASPKTAGATRPKPAA